MVSRVAMSAGPGSEVVEGGLSEGGVPSEDGDGEEERRRERGMKFDELFPSVLDGSSGVVFESEIDHTTKETKQCQLRRTGQPRRRRKGELNEREELLDRRSQQSIVIPVDVPQEPA